MSQNQEKNRDGRAVSSLDSFNRKAGKAGRDGRESYLKHPSPHLVVEEVYSVVVKFQRQGLQEGDVVRHDLLI